MPAINELVVLDNNVIQTVLLVNTLTGTVVRTWQHGIQTLRLCNSLMRDTIPLDHLEMFYQCPVVVNKLHLPCADKAFSASLARLLQTKRITLAPDPRSQTFHSYMHAACPCSAQAVGHLHYPELISLITSEEPYHLHVHTEEDCTALWITFWKESATHQVGQLSITFFGDAGGMSVVASLRHLRFQRPVTVHVKRVFELDSQRDNCVVKTSDLAATFKVYCSTQQELQEADQFCNWLQGLFKRSQIQMYVMRGSDWVLDNIRPAAEQVTNCTQDCLVVL